MNKIEKIEMIPLPKNPIKEFKKLETFVRLKTPNNSFSIH